MDRKEHVARFRHASPLTQKKDKKIKLLIEPTFSLHDGDKLTMLR